MSGTVKTEFGEASHNVGRPEVLAIREDLASRGRTGKALFDGIRTETFALIELQCPQPSADKVTDAHRIAADKLRSAGDKHIKDGHHWIQRAHGIALWQETDRLLAELGISATTV